MIQIGTSVVGVVIRGQFVIMGMAMSRLDNTSRMIAGVFCSVMQGVFKWDPIAIGNNVRNK